jgi:DNA (cytosine-5)-methyltransferase 1
MKSTKNKELVTRKKKVDGNKLKALDFFCGAGGMSCGFQNAGIEILAGIDIEKDFEKTYTTNHRRAKFINRDITRYQPYELHSELELKKFDDNLIFIGCSPCQYWSKINTIKHNSVYSNNLIYDFQRFIKYFMPGYVVVENVPGIIKKSNNHILLNFLDFLTFNGYKYEYQLINTNLFGVPQKRNRFLLISSRLNKKILFPEPVLDKKLTVRDFIGVENGFPKIPAGHKDETCFLHTTASLSKLNLERIKRTPKNGGTRISWKNYSRLQLKAYKGKDNMFSNIYGRMFWDKPASTITTRFIATSCGRFAHPEENRGLSLREGATLQTFPKRYKFIGSMISIARQIGNAVPPKMAEKIALSIKKI